MTGNRTLSSSSHLVPSTFPGDQASLERSNYDLELPTVGAGDIHNAGDFVRTENSNTCQPRKPGPG